ncbi:MAG: hypothetical protein SYC29_09545 [Planctomycetota bacterium]|nr:hypothetical protein [Planctomycetota bacterium]
MTGKSDDVWGHAEDTDSADLAAPVLSEQAYMQRRLDRSGRGFRLRGATPGGMLIDQWMGQVLEPSATAPTEAQRPAA